VSHRSKAPSLLHGHSWKAEIEHLQNGPNLDTTYYSAPGPGFKYPSQGPRALLPPTRGRLPYNANQVRSLVHSNTVILNSITYLKINSSEANTAITQIFLLEFCRAFSVRFLVLKMP